MKFLLLLPLFYLFTNIDASHFRGGIISWRALNTTPNGSTATFLVYQRYSWRKGSSAAAGCPTLGGLMSITSVDLECYYGSCSGWPSSSSTISTNVYCTDYDSSIDYSSGERYDQVTLTLGTSRSVGFYSNAWLALAYNLGQGYWSVMNLLYAYVRPDGKINTSPVTTTLPVIYKTVNVQHVHIIPMADADSSDILVCRWATGGTSSGNPATSTAFTNNPVQRVDECGSTGVCQTSIPGAQLFGNNCTMIFTLASSQVNEYFAVALQIEDFYNSSYTTPMSSVPIQFLFYAVAAPSSCTVRPLITGVRPNRACIGTPVNSSVTELVVAQPGCSGVSIVKFTTTSPAGLTKSSLVYDSSANTYTMTLSWVPLLSQAGPQGFCAAAVDSLNQQGDQWCITFVVGADSPNLNTPVFVQGSASPLGTVFANQSIFSIQASKSVNRPTLNGTNIYFRDASTNQPVVYYDAGYAQNILYTGNTIVIKTNYTWSIGHTYYITMDEGFSSGTEFCGPESVPITDPTFWRFNIWDPGLSSTTTTTTTPPTTHTVTTLGISTTTVNTLLTTVGIITSTPTTATTTTSETTTTTETTSTTTAIVINATTPTIPDVVIYTPKDMEEACKNPLAIISAAQSVVLIVINIASMSAWFSYMSKAFDPNIIAQQVRHKQRLRQMKRN